MSCNCWIYSSRLKNKKLRNWHAHFRFRRILFIEFQIFYMKSYGYKKKISIFCSEILMIKVLRFGSSFFYCEPSENIHTIQIFEWKSQYFNQCNDVLKINIREKFKILPYQHKLSWFCKNFVCETIFFEPSKILSLTDSIKI